MSHLPPFVQPVPGTNRVWIVDSWIETFTSADTRAGATDVALFELSPDRGWIKTSWRTTLGYASLEPVALADGSLVLRGEPSGGPPHLVRIVPEADGTTSVSAVVTGTDIGLPRWLQEMWRVDGDRIAVLGRLEGQYGRVGRADRWSLVVLESDLSVAAAAFELVDPSMPETLPNEFPQLERIVEEWDGSRTFAFLGASDVDPVPAPLSQCWVSRMRPDGTFITPSPGLLVNPVEYSSLARSSCSTSARTAGRVEARYMVTTDPADPYPPQRAVLVSSDFSSTSPLPDVCAARIDGTGTVFEICSSTAPPTIRRYDSDDTSTLVGPIYGERCSSNSNGWSVYAARTEGLWITYGDDVTDVDGHEYILGKVIRMHADGRIGWTPRTP